MVGTLNGRDIQATIGIHSFIIAQEVPDFGIVASGILLNPKPSTMLSPIVRASMSAFLLRTLQQAWTELKTLRLHLGLKSAL